MMTTSATDKLAYKYICDNGVNGHVGVLTALNTLQGVFSRLWNSLSLTLMPPYGLHKQMGTSAIRLAISILFQYNNKIVNNPILDVMY